MTSYWVLLVIISLCHTGCKVTSTCVNQNALSNLDTAVDMISKVKSNLPVGFSATYTCEEQITVDYLDKAVGMIREAKSTIPESNICEKNSTEPYRRAIDCSELLQMGYTKSGVYTIWPALGVTEDKSLKVYCDMQTNGGGWTVIQRRGNFQNKVDYFFKLWKSYKEGFGDIEKEFWLGNDNIFALTNQKIYSVRFELKDVENNTRYAEYSTFRIEDENQKYKLYIEDYTGDAGDAMSQHNGGNFSTQDQDNDSESYNHCAQNKRGGWWYRDCRANINGLNLRGMHYDISNGLSWDSWKGYTESLESSEIKIRPKYINLHKFSMNTPM